MEISALERFPSIRGFCLQKNLKLIAVLAEILFEDWVTPEQEPVGWVTLEKVDFLPHPGQFLPHHVGTLIEILRDNSFCQHFHSGVECDVLSLHVADRV